MLQINSELRIVDLDPIQYAVQKRGVEKGKEVWKNVGFHRTLKSLAARVRERVGDEAAREAAHAAYAEFDKTSLTQDILALPPKEKEA